MKFFEIYFLISIVSGNDGFSSQHDLQFILKFISNMHLNLDVLEFLVDEIEDIKKRE
jgi:hypothetical protein